MLAAIIAAAFKTWQTILVRNSLPGGLRLLDYLVLREERDFQV
jgi:hypothetical protein